MRHKVPKFLLAIAVAMTLTSGVALSAPAAPNGAVAAVATLYRDYAWEAVIERPGFSDPCLFKQPGGVLGRYFDKRWVDLIQQEQRCSEKSHAVCRLDFQPMWGSQDPGASQLEVLPTADPAAVTVQFIYPGDNSHIKLTYYLIRTAAGWRITDIHGADWSLRSILESNP